LCRHAYIVSQETTAIFDRADDGNIALMGELNIDGEAEFTLALGFGYSVSMS
jgi:hypothetical protein